MVGVSLTRALVARHGAGRSDTYDAALLDVAQDHLLWLLAELKLFDAGRLVFKGGTSLRKCRPGGAERFSTDLDFAAPSDDTVIEICTAIDGASVSGFTFSVEPSRGDGCHWGLTVEHPELGRPNIGASIEFARRPLILPAEDLPFVALPVHRSYTMPLPSVPTIAEAEPSQDPRRRNLTTILTTTRRDGTGSGGTTTRPDGPISISPVHGGTLRDA